MKCCARWPSCPFTSLVYCGWKVRSSAERSVAWRCPPLAQEKCSSRLVVLPHVSRCSANGAMRGRGGGIQHQPGEWRSERDDCGCELRARGIGGQRRGRGGPFHD